MQLYQLVYFGFVEDFIRVANEDLELGVILILVWFFRFRGEELESFKLTLVIFQGHLDSIAMEGTLARK